VNSHIDTHYSDHLKICTDGSKPDNEQVGAAFVIPAHNIEKIYHITSGVSIFTAELFAILMALNYFVPLLHKDLKIVLCVDSKSVLCALNSLNQNTRLEMITEIKHVVHLLSLKGIIVTFCWVPSHCGIIANEWVDRAVRLRACNVEGSLLVNIPLDLREGYELLKHTSFNKAIKNYSILLIITLKIA